MVNFCDAHLHRYVLHWTMSSSTSRFQSKKANLLIVNLWKPETSLSTIQKIQPQNQQIVKVNLKRCCAAMQSKLKIEILLLNAVHYFH